MLESSDGALFPQPGKLQHACSASDSKEKERSGLGNRAWAANDLSLGLDDQRRLSKQVVALGASHRRVDLPVLDKVLDERQVQVEGEVREVHVKRAEVLAIEGEVGELDGIRSAVVPDVDDDLCREYGVRRRVKAVVNDVVNVTVAWPELVHREIGWVRNISEGDGRRARGGGEP